jgi:uncharacterized membrane protein YfcA
MELTVSVALIVTIGLLGCVGGFSSGLLGFGGGVVMFPLLYYVPQLAGLEPLDAKTVASIVVAQVFFSTIVGGAAHVRAGRVHWRIALVAGLSSAAAALIGGMASVWVSERFLLVLFGALIVAVLVMMLLPGPTDLHDALPTEQLAVPRFPLILTSWGAGLMIGFLGAGNFIFVPLLIYTMKVPTRIAIGSSLFIAMINTFFGFVGKMVTGQVPLVAATAVVLGAAIGAWAGEHIHSRLSTRTIRYIYAAMLVLVGVRVWLTVFGFDA